MLNGYSVDDIEIGKYIGEDEWNEPLSGSGSVVEIRGYVEWKTKLVRNIKGEEVVSTIQIYIEKRRLDLRLGRALVHEDRVKSINGDDIDRAIMAIQQPKAFSRPHYEIDLA
jgi:hypothetical protein